MVTKFDNFLNEFYTGTYASAGFKTSEPTDEYEFTVDIEYDPKNEEIIKNNILSKYNIPYNDFSLKHVSNAQELKIKIISYNKWEASSIISTLLDSLHKNDIAFDPRSIEAPTLRIGDRTKVSGFK
jgi:hypothetical protein